MSGFRFAVHPSVAQSVRRADISDKDVGAIEPDPDADPWLPLSLPGIIDFFHTPFRPSEVIEFRPAILAAWHKIGELMGRRDFNAGTYFRMDHFDGDGDTQAGRRLEQATRPERSLFEVPIMAGAMLY